VAHFGILWMSFADEIAIAGNNPETVDLKKVSSVTEEIDLTQQYRT
jgi:hypothetical protein